MTCAECKRSVDHGPRPADDICFDCGRPRSERAKERLALASPQTDFTAPCTLRA